METIFRPYHPASGQRSDRSAGDRLRHRQKVREAIRNNIADIIAEESIIGKDNNRIVKVPIRGVKEYRFVYGENVRQAFEYAACGNADATITSWTLLQDKEGILLPESWHKPILPETGLSAATTST
jgi:hypothetical protein